MIRLILQYAAAGLLGVASRAGGLVADDLVSHQDIDWPVVLVHLLVRRELGPLRERRRGTRLGLAREPLRAPFELSTVTFSEALRRQLALLRLRATGSLPAHFD